MQEGFLRDRGYLVVGAFAIVDGLILIASAMLMHFYYFGSFEMHYVYKITIVVSFLLCAWLFPALGMYDLERGRTLRKNLYIVFTSWLMVFTALLIIGALTKTNWQMSRIWVGLWFCFGASATLLFRMAVWAVVNRMRTAGANVKYVVIVGEGPLAEKAINKIKSNPWLGLSITGYFGREQMGDAKEFEGLARLGDYSELAAYSHKTDIDEIWVALPLRQGDELSFVLEQLKHSLSQVRIIPDMQSFQLINYSASEFDGMPIINATETPIRGLNELVKLVEDKVLSFLILMMILPVMLVIAVMVKLSSPGPVFYRQVRVSLNGKPFEMLKFRSMPIDVEEKTGPKWASKGENRATKVGQFLRSTSLDELPQFINVLKGDMSIVGPRPERPVFVDQFKEDIPGYMQKHFVKAGITGWAQVNGWRGDTCLKERINHDLCYIKNWSLGFDLKIIFLTLFKGLINKNAY